MPRKKASNCLAPGMLAVPLGGDVQFFRIGARRDRLPAATPCPLERLLRRAVSPNLPFRARPNLDAGIEGTHTTRLKPPDSDPLAIR